MFIGVSVSINTKVVAGGGSPAPPTGYARLVPLGSTALITSNGDTFNVKE